MAVNLTAVFRVRDQGTSRLRQITSMMDRMNRTSRTTSDSMSRAQSATNRLGGAVSSATGRMDGFSARVSRLHVGSNGLSASFGGLQSTLLGLASAYLTAQGAAKAFDMTIGAAARYEQAEVAVKAIFNDTKKSSAYLQMVDKMAIDSPLLNSKDMLSSSKSLVAMTKDVKELGKAWSIIERLMVLDPTQGTEGAAFALKELWQGDAVSMVERFGLNRGELNDIKKMDIPQQISELNKMLDGMGLTQKTVEAMGSTTLGFWSQIGERVEKIMRQIGNLSNSKLGDALGNVVKTFDKSEKVIDSLVKKLDTKLASLVDKAIAFGKLLWQWREPIVYVVGAIAAAVGTLAGVGVIAALANPVSLIAAGIAAAVVGFKALYDNSEMFRGAIDGIVGKAKSLWSAFKTGGTGGLISALFPPDIANQINSIVDGIKAKISGLMTAFKTGGFKGVLEMLISPEAISAMTSRFATIKEQVISVFTSLVEAVLPVLQTLWSTAQPILSALWDALKIVADVVMLAWNNIIAPTITFVMKTFKLMWTVIGPILELLGAAIGAAFKILRLVWDTIVGPFVAFLAGGFTQAFGAATEIVKALTPAFKTVGGWISTAAGYLKDFAAILGNIKMPDWIGKIGSGAVSWAKKLIPGKDGGAAKSHYSGLDSVPYDGYAARLHKGERVLTARENRDYSEGNGGGNGTGGGVFISGNNFTVREDADIHRIAFELAKLIEQEMVQTG
ncbi:phage tail tape measure protein [Lysinibacillus fusiformis]|uniref:phage tail protein n=1 Tax=Lysinibacillus fusiformis TaxID=28031 RepID=UPI003019A532